MPEPRVTCVHGELQLVLNSIALVHEGNVLWTRLSTLDCQSVCLRVYLSLFRSLCAWVGSELSSGWVDPRVGLGCD